MSKLLKNLIIVAIITLIGGIAYILMKGDTSTPADGVAQASISQTEVALRTEKILSDTQEVSTYKLDVSIFSDERFISLQDYGVEIRDERTGRDNPFDPVR